MNYTKKHPTLKKEEVEYLFYVFDSNCILPGETRSVEFERDVLNDSYGGPDVPEGPDVKLSFYEFANDLRVLNHVKNIKDGSEKRWRTMRRTPGFRDINMHSSNTLISKVFIKMDTS